MHFPKGQKMINSKKDLEVKLSKLEQIKSPKVELEQYATPSDIAAEVLWHAYMNDAIKDKTEVEIEGLTIPVISKKHLIKNKEATGREKDKLDVRKLREK